MKGFPEYLNDSADMFGMHFSLSKRKLLLWDWTDLKAIFVLAKDEDAIGNFNYLNICISTTDRTPDETHSRIKRDFLEFKKLKASLTSACCPAIDQRSVIRSSGEVGATVRLRNMVIKSRRVMNSDLRTLPSLYCW